IYFSPIRVTF
nr:Chain C, NP-164-173 peptide from influenza B, IYFSPIRVTF [Influenza A virus]7JYU_F Chain F, NP-164-173 peptide from influenza B, IYFSPIRVTF [Influenza A virus]